MRVLLIGQRSFGAAVLERLHADGHELVAAPPRPDDRMAVAARTRRVPLVHGTVADAELVRNAGGADVIVTAHSHLFVSRAARHRVAHAVGYHPSLLPRHRGRSSVEWTIRFGDPVAGGTVYHLDDRIDAGDVQLQEWCWVLPGDTASSLWARELFPLGVRALGAACGELERGAVVRIRQDERCATWEPAIDPPRLARPDLPELPSPDGERVLWRTTR